MSRLLCLLLLQLFAVSTLGQSLPHEEPDNSSEPPDAIVQSLYSQVITRHPLGIPSGENWKVFGPYLSKGLLREISLARSCQSDWVRQNKGQMVKEPFAWGETGFFSGDEELSEPSSFQIERTESNRDGSFRVYVKLTESVPNEKPWSWDVAVEVVAEEKRLVIDDVIYLKGEEVRTEYRLSRILKEGCDGSRWVGLVDASPLGSGLVQSVVSNSDMIEYDRRLAESHRTIFPAAGIIPDAETAESVALAVAIPIWGREKVTSELPLRAGLKGNVWTVIGDPHLHGGEVGGELIIQLDKRTGAVLSFLHTQ